MNHLSTRESTESSVEKQEENIQDIAATETGLEEHAENAEELSALDENPENQHGVNVMEQEEDLGESAEDELKDNGDKNSIFIQL